MNQADSEISKLLEELENHARNAHDALTKITESIKCSVCGESPTVTKTADRGNGWYSLMFSCPNYNPDTGKNHYNQKVTKVSTG